MCNNGFTLRLQWCHRLSAMESAHVLVHALLPRHASMVPSPLSDGKGQCQNAFQPDKNGFNGAIASQRWKGAPPRQPATERRRFNGAIASQRWKVQGQGHREVLGYVASMVPSPLSDGKFHIIHNTVFVRLNASMVPSPLSDGKWRVRQRTGLRPSCFNGAIASQRWKAASNGKITYQTVKASMVPSPLSDGKLICGVGISLDAAASMVPSPLSDGKSRAVLRHGRAVNAASMVPSPLSDGKSACLRPLIRGPVGFNGAIASQRWKAVVVWDSGPVPVAASMVPSPLSDGKLPLLHPARHESVRFNGAIASQRWKASESSPRPLAARRLQWCHRLSAMESWRGMGCREGCGPASMVPSPLSDGKWRSRPRASPRLRSFNGALASQRWKGRIRMAILRGNYGLQWCHRLSAMESRDTGCNLHPSCLLQWCHRLSAMERRGKPSRYPPGPRERLVIDPVLNASMVPSPLSDGKCQNNIPLSSTVVDASMVPSPLSDGKCAMSLCLRVACGGFNGAIASQRWKGRYRSNTRRSRIPVLQWCHRLSAMER